MRTCAAIVFAVFMTCASVFGQGKSVQGVWAMTEVETTGPNGSTAKITQPSLYLFTKKHYSIIFVSSTEPRPEIADLSAATADELRRVFVRDFVANAGTYEIKGGKITLRPMVAKSPTVMKPGNFSTLMVKFEGDTMTLVSESNQAGPVTNRTTTRLRRVE